MKEYKIGTTPGQAAHRKIWVTLTESEQEAILDRVVELYDGTKTLGACWILALSEKGII
jgi:hypothetical protein